MRKVVLIITMLLSCLTITVYANDFICTKNNISYSVNMDNISIYDDILVFNMIIDNPQDKDLKVVEIAVNNKTNEFRFDNGTRYDKKTNLRIDSEDKPTRWSPIEEGSVAKKAIDYVKNNYKETPPVIYKGRWALANDSKDAKTYFDVYTYYVVPINNQLCVNCWLRTETPKFDAVEHIIFKIDDVSYISKEVKIYDKNGNLKESVDSTEKGWEQTTPGSKREKDLKEIVIWIDKHHNSYPARTID